MRQACKLIACLIFVTQFGRGECDTHPHFQVHVHFQKSFRPGAEIDEVVFEKYGKIGHVRIVVYREGLKISVFVVVCSMQHETIYIRRILFKAFVIRYAELKSQIKTFPNHF